MEFRSQTEAEIEAAQTLAGFARDFTPLDERQDVAVAVRTEAGPIFQAAFIYVTKQTMQ